MEKLFFQRLGRAAFLLGIIAAIFAAFYYVSTITYPFLIAIVLSMMINPLVNVLEKKVKLPRWLAVTTSMLLLFAAIIGLTSILVVEVVAGTTYLAKVVPQHVNSLVNYFDDVTAKQIIPLYEKLAKIFKNLDVSQQGTILENIQAVGKTVAATVGSFIKAILSSIPVIIGSLPNLATILIFSLLATFFISKDWYSFGAFFRRVLPDKATDRVLYIADDLKKALFGFVRAQATLISITTVIVLIGLLIFGVDHAITIALITGIVDVLPYLGTGSVFVPWIIYSIFDGDTTLAIQLAVLYAVVLVQRQIMEPKILSTTIGLDPLATLVALFVGFKLFGFLGLILGPVSLVIFKTLHSANVFTEAWHYIKGDNRAA